MQFLFKEKTRALPGLLEENIMKKYIACPFGSEELGF